MHSLFMSHSYYTFTGIVVRVYIDIMFRMFCVHFKSELQLTNTLGNNDKSNIHKKVMLLSYSNSNKTTMNI